MSLSKIDAFFQAHFNTVVTGCEATVVPDYTKNIDKLTGALSLLLRKPRVLLTIRGIILDGELALLMSYGCLLVNTAVVEVCRDGVRVRLALDFCPEDGPEALELARLLKVVV